MSVVIPTAPYSRKNQKIDFTGKKVGNLFIIKELEPQIKLNKGKPYWVRFWQCKCVCGEIIVRNQRSLRKNIKDNHNCGCLHKFIIKKSWENKKRPSGEDSCKWTGYKEISGRYWHNLKSSAKNRDILFNLKIEDAWELFLKQDEKCKLTGLSIGFKDKTASIDRINSNECYSINNIQWVHKDVNKMKMDFEVNHFINMCHLVSQYNQEKL